MLKFEFAGKYGKSPIQIKYKHLVAYTAIAASKHISILQVGNKISQRGN